MRAIKVAVFAAFLLGSFGALKAQSVDEVMSKYLAAIGTREAWSNLKTLKMDGAMSVQGNDIAITITTLPGKAMRQDISAMGMNGFQIVTKTQGWMYMPFMGQSKVDTMKADMLKAAQAQLDVKGKEMYDYKTNGTKTEYLGMDTINKVLCYRIKFIDKDGNETMCYFNTKTYFLLRTETKVKQDDQEQEVSMAFDNYKALDGGVVMPMSISSPYGDITFKSIEVNKPVDESIFIPTMPGAGK